MRLVRRLLINGAHETGNLVTLVERKRLTSPIFRLLPRSLILAA